MRGVSGRKDEAGLWWFLDKLGERLAAETLNVSLLDALAYQRERGPEVPGFPAGTIDLMRGQELAHVRLLERGIRMIGGSAAVPTPAARRIAPSAESLQRIVHGHGSFAASVEAILLAELREVTGWEDLIPEAESYLGALAWEFRGALLEELEHSRTLRDWLTRYASGVLFRTA